MRRLQVLLERDLVMRCAERATAEDMATAAWISKTLASAIEASGQDGETRLDAKHESAVGSEASETPTHGRPAIDQDGGEG